jgi:N-acetylglucosaminyldiphosphoundecaprenol N-acetyl-beta-D-mannosaminyltransferase
MQREKIFTISVSTGRYSDFINEILRLPDNNFSSYVCFANVHMTIEAYRNSSFNDVVNKANIVAPDGKPLSIFLRLTRGIRQERVAGMDIFPQLLREASNQKKSI